MEAGRTDWAGELEAALTAARRAAAVLSARTGTEEIREKGRADLVTVIDEQSERVVEACLRERFPDDRIIGEEFSGTGSGVGRRWIVDPLDGTVNFVHRHPFACVSIGLVDEDGPAVGVVHAPFLGEVYWASREGGAFLNGDRIVVSRVDQAGQALIATGFPFKSGKGEPTAYFDLVEEVVLTTHGVRRAGSAALDLAYLACGRLDGYFELGLGSWDIAAGMLLVTEAGGTISGWRGDQEPPLSTGRLLASNGRIHGWLESTTDRYRDRL